MNITDIDDKIIKRARQNHLYENYVSENQSLDKILMDAKEVMSTFEDTVKKTTDPDKKNMYEKMLVRVKDAVQKLEGAVKANDQAQIKVFQDVSFVLRTLQFIYLIIFAIMWKNWFILILDFAKRSKRSTFRLAR